jgi:hypothetical protein
MSVERWSPYLFPCRRPYIMYIWPPPVELKLKTWLIAKKKVVSINFKALGEKQCNLSLHLAYLLS